MKNRVLAMLLALTMLLGMIPLTASAAEAAPKITSSSLTLDSILSLNITADLAGGNAADYTVQVKIGEDTTPQVLTSENGIYTASLLAHRMYEPVTVELVTAGSTVDSGTWQLTEYLARLRADYASNQSMMDLLTALESYGQYAAYYADDAKEGLNISAVEAVTAENILPHKLQIVQANAALKATAGLYLDEACDIRFKFDETAIAGKSVYINDALQQSTATQSGKVTYTVSQLQPKDWDTVQNVVVKDGDATVYALNFTVLSYAYMKLSRATAEEAELCGLLKAMYLYNAAADAYVPSAPVTYVKLADSFLALAPTTTSADGLPANASVANIYTGGWTATSIAEGIELAKYSELMFYVKTSDANKWFELYEGDKQLFATNSSEWVKVQLKLEGNVWTLYTDGTWRLSNLTGDTLAELLPKVTLGGSANADVYVSDLLGIKNPDYVDPYAKIADDLLTVTGTAADNIPEDFENSTQLTIGWTADGVPFAAKDLAPYVAIKFAIQSTAWHGVSLNGATIAQHSGNEWVEYLFVKNGDGWDFTFNGEQQAPVALSDLSDLTLLTGGSDIYYVTELRAIADPDYVPPAPPALPAYITLPGNPFTKDGEATTEESLEGFETVTKLSTSWNKYDFHSVDLAPYSQVEFAVKSAGWYGLMPDSSTVINETNNGGNWLIIKLVKNGAAWDVYYGDALQQSVTLASNNISDLNFRFGDNTYYVTNLRALADPNYVPEVYVTVADSIFDIEGTASTETIEGYETITAHATSWNRYSFKSFDLTPYIKVKFAVKSAGWYGLMPDTNTVINESSGTVEIELIKNGDVWGVYYNGTYQQDVTLPNNNLTDLNFRFGGNTYHVSELKAVYDPNYVIPKVGIIEMDPFTLYGTAAPEESVEGYDFVTALTTSWNKYNFVDVDLTNYTEVWFSVKSAGYYGVMNGDSVINETNGGGNWMEIRLVKNGGNWDIYYGGALQQSVTLSNNKLTDLNFRFGSNTYYVTELMGKENTENPYVSEYVQVAANFINNTPTSTTAEGLTSRDVSVINITNCGWASPGVVDGINMADYAELKFWYKVSNTNKWFEMYDASGNAFYQGHATDWTEMKFQQENNGTWTFYANGEGKKWGLSGAALKDVIATLTLGGSETADVYVTDLIGKYSHTLNLVQSGATNYSIVYEDGAGEAFAASELSKYFDAATSLELSAAAYTAEDAVPARAIVLGTAPAKAAGLSTANLGPSDYIITNKDAKLYIYGATEQGTVNGVYAFLEEQFGLDVFYKDTYTINALEGDLILEPFTTVGNANFDYLYSGYGELRPDKNGGDREYAYMMGTVLDYEVSGSGIHNMLSVISKEEYGESHPEWFYTGTTADGYNTGDQLYLAVDDFAAGEGTLVSAVADKLYAGIQDNTNKDIFGLSPMDIDIWPTGTGFEKSDALKTQYGTNAAEYILFMNAVAQELDSKVSRPITLQLLAYNKTLVAPSGLELYNGTNVKVVPFVAPVESNFHMTFADSRNLVKNPETGVIDGNSKTVAQVIEGWDALCDEIHLWWYSVDAYSYFMPLNSYDNMGTNYQFAYEHDVKVIFHQSQFDTAVSTDWSRMKIYLQRELAKDPYADVDTLIDSFINAYFGAGAEDMKKLMDSQRDWYANLLKKSNQDTGAYWLGTLRGSAFCTQDSNNRKQWTTYQIGTSSSMLTSWMKYCTDAKAAINADSSLTDEQKTELCKRVDLESLPARYVLVKVFGSTTYDASMEAFLQFAKTLGVTGQGEGNPI